MTENPVLTRYDGFPGTLLEVSAAELWRQLPGPSLIRISGRDGAPLLITVLLHGNEDTGWRAVQQVLLEHRRSMLARPLLVFVGNVAAAKARTRTLPDQEDYNRSWPGTSDPETPTARLMAEVVEIVGRERPFASIDIHNNSGNNPHYACVSSLAEQHLHLARLFSRTVVYFTRPLGVQSAAFAPICPAVTVECGRAGPITGVSHAAEFISAALALQHFPGHPVPTGDLDLMRTFAIIKVPADASFSYDGSDTDFRFRDDLDRLNFSELEAGTCFGRLGGSGTKRLDVVPGAEVTAVGPYFDYGRGEIRLSRPAIPAMLTLDPHAVRLDSLGYLMHRIGRDGRRLAD